MFPNLLQRLDCAAASRRAWLIAAVALLFVLAQALMSCNYTRKITDGPTAYELMRYHEAVPMLEKEYKAEKSRVQRGKIAWMLGESYREQHQPAEAREWYRQAYDLQYGPEALERYAQTLMQTEQYKEALAAYEELGREIGSRYQYRRQVQAAQMAMEFDVARQGLYSVAKTELGLGASTYAANYTQGDVLLISADERATTGKRATDPYAWTGRTFSDLYLQPLGGGEAVALAGRINGPFNEGAATISPGGKELVFTRCAPMGDEAGYCRLMRAEREGDAWSEPQALAFQEGEVNYVQPAWSADGNLLYFSSDSPDAVGGYDLYFVERVPPHEWSSPTRLPRTINTAANEHWPSLRGDTLYFASDGHAGFGGLDIFRTYPFGSDGWASPYNLLPPVNGGGDDFAVSFPRMEARGGDVLAVMTSNRGDGQDQIYTLGAPPPRPVDPAPVDSTAAELPVWRLLITVVESILQDPSDPGSRVLGKKPLEAATVKVEPAGADSTLSQNEPGVYSLTVEPEIRYRFLANAPGYLSRDGVFSTQGLRKLAGDRGQTFELEIELNKVYTNREIALQNIYYDLDKADIRADAQPTLRALARDLQLNPGLRIRMGAHTDCRGGDAYNRELSQRRAESAVKFLIEQGVNGDRLEATGFGEDVPLTTCACSRCTEDEHQLNRRTTFTVLE